MTIEARHVALSVLAVVAWSCAGSRQEASRLPEPTPAVEGTDVKPLAAVDAEPMRDEALSQTEAPVSQESLSPHAAEPAEGLEDADTAEKRMAAPPAASLEDAGEAEESMAAPEPRLDRAKSAEAPSAGRPAPAPPASAAPAKKEQDKGKGAEVTTWKRAAALPNSTRLMIGDQEELPLAGVQAHVKVDGFRARVVLDCYYYNDRDQQYEGTFKLRLPTAASPYLFAFGETTFRAADAKPVFFTAEQVAAMGADSQQVMQERRDTWREPKQARMVPKEKAAHAYAETVRRRVDPAIMEWAGAGIFSARVFPLAPRKLHRIVMGYDVDLVAAGSDLEYRFDVPEVKAALVVDVDVAPIAGVAVEVAPASSAKSAGGRLLRFEHPAEAITVRLKEPGPLMLSGTDAETGPYFAAGFAPELPAEQTAAGGGEAIFLVDVSLSANPDGFNVWLQLLRAILDNNRDRVARFGVVFFNVEAFWWREQLTPNTPENVRALMDAAESLALEGATDLGAAIREAVRPRWAKEAQQRRDIFLLSDGAVTWGEGDARALAHRLRAGGTLFAYTTGLSGTDTQLLSQLARESGGAVFSVTGEAEIQAASTAHRFRPWSLESVEVRGAGDLMLAGRPRALFPGQQLRLVGRGDLQPGVEVRLALSRGSERREVVTKVRRGLRSELAARAYGQVAVEQLEELKEATEKVSIAYGCHFRVTGQSCSLLMLESEEDYRRFDIHPEQHAAAIVANPAAELIARVLAEAGQALGDPKLAFLAWLDKMSLMPGFSFAVSAELKAALTEMPSSSFRVEVPSLKARAHQREALPAALVTMLAKRELAYDALTSEAERRLQKWGAADALRALSSLVEHNPGDGVLARDVGFTAMGWGLKEQAFHLFERVAHARPYEPQTYRAMANVLDEMGQADLALAYYEVGLAGQWDSRFGEYRRILMMDYVRFLQRLAGGALESSVPAFARARLATLRGEIGESGADLLVSITWNTDSTDVDLHVIEPSGEECYYSHNSTAMGGRLTTDVTQGYGPEMYVLPKAKPGKYKVRVKYFASDSNRASARTKVYATVYRHWGTRREKEERKVVTLEYGKEMHDIATVVIGRD